MITNLGEKISHKLAASGTISPDDVDLYSYGFFLLLSSVLYLVVVAILGSAFGILWESIVFYFLFSILREYAGGIHAKTERGCMFSTILALLLSISGISGMMQAELSSAATVAPSGDIYKCVTGVGSKRFLLTTYNEFLNNPLMLIQKNISQIEQSHRSQCLTCDYLTMCNGGCKCQHYEKGDVLCRKKLLSNEMDFFMRLLAIGEFTQAGFFKGRNW